MVAAVKEMVRFSLLFAHMRTKSGRSVPAQHTLGSVLVPGKLDTKSGPNDSLQEKAAKKSVCPLSRCLDMQAWLS